MKYLDTRKRLLAVDKLLREETTSRSKFESMRTLIKGIDPKLDEALASAAKVINKLEQIHKQKVIKLVAEAWPAKTKEQKRRKKLLLLLIKLWGQLKNEVRRVTKLLEAQQGKQQTGLEKAQTGGKIAAYAKGPLGVITLVAAAIAAGVIALKSTAVEVTIVNQGCQSLNPTTSVAVNLPGLKLPAELILEGQSAVAVLPPIKFVVDGTSSDMLFIRAYGINLSFAYGEGVDIVFNGSQLVGKRTEINLGSQKQHTLLVRCS